MLCAARRLLLLCVDIVSSAVLCRVLCLCVLLCVMSVCACVVLFGVECVGVGCLLCFDLCFPMSLAQL